MPLGESPGRRNGATTREPGDRSALVILPTCGERVWSGLSAAVTTEVNRCGEPMQPLPKFEGAYARTGNPARVRSSATCLTTIVGGDPCPFIRNKQSSR